MSSETGAGPISEEVLRETIVELVDSTRSPESTRCPSEVPRRLAKEGRLTERTEWRDYMDATRKVVFEMRDQGELEVMQKGQIVEVGLEEIRGPIRMRRKLLPT
ncbi:hypothetical protein SAICODRAFT_8692 [Saitoella complicata NRRL Y-17804]|uniref:uncharacterized protein n=1 Tax=Saitoella complicata (strain BCRC 22490 / CBS 7301 / JCM 7358 / NBRC 10748 / NRRL Y-17804) TaxID=698492 RepID=UPI000866CAE5|nr:uncharacterized protein SAICODRAFT_8692 [Saitoella complicata NRRL Y-17804]ODQ51764.1 hypothetical protein SAICODRAFT_8692 [Saitoella complicata NRRL Y-17804]